MDNPVYVSYRIEDRSYLSYIKREIHNLVGQAGFSSQRTGETDIVISELTSNLIKHATSGELIYRMFSEKGIPAFEIFCLDAGPGTNDILRAMKDGISTTNTLGHGLGAILRLSDFFQIYSRQDWGTVAYARIYARALDTHPANKAVVDLKAIQLSKAGEKLCGDGYFVKYHQAETQIFLGDGLGHGSHAHHAASTAINAFMDCSSSDPVEILRHIHTHAKKTRGLVGSVAVLNHATGKWNIAGIGNITVRLYDGLTSKNYMPHNGIIGMNIPKTMKSYEADVEKHQLIMMYSDGIKNRWELGLYPSIFKYDPSVIAAAIFRDQARRTDDMTLLVGKINL